MTNQFSMALHRAAFLAALSGSVIDAACNAAIASIDSRPSERKRHGSVSLWFGACTAHSIARVRTSFGIGRPAAKLCVVRRFCSASCTGESAAATATSNSVRGIRTSAVVAGGERARRPEPHTTHTAGTGCSTAQRRRDCVCAGSELPAEAGSQKQPRRAQTIVA